MTELWAPKIYSPVGFNRKLVLGDARALDVGCGDRKLPNAIGMDIIKVPSVDVQHSFDIFPWPFPDNSFDLVFLNHALEHVEDVVAVVNEIHRVLKPTGRLVIQVPYFRSLDAFTDPTHRHFFTARTLDYFVQGSGLSHYQYNDSLFIKKGFWYGWPHLSRNPLVRRFKSFITSHPQFYDQYLSLVLPMKCLTWELEAIK